MQLPYLFLKNRIAKRQLSIKRAFPDALDLLLICVESGMSIEAAFKKVSVEIGSQSIALAEELTLTTAELSYLQDRKQAYENLAKRTDLEGVKSVCMALQQAERYGTPLGQTLRVMAQENRDMRMSEAEKKAAALPPKLTVPMILFFLPVLFIVILGPAAIRVMATQDRVEHQHAGGESVRTGTHAELSAQEPVDGASGEPRWFFFQSLLLRQHLPQIGDVGRRLARRQVAARDRLGLLEAALQADHQREILPHLRLGARPRRRRGAASPPPAAGSSTARRTGRDWTAPTARPASAAARWRSSAARPDGGPSGRAPRPAPTGCANRADRACARG